MMREGDVRSGLVKSRDLYLSVFDRTSPVNRPGEFDRAWQKAGAEDLRIWSYNQYWIDRQDLEAIQAWILLLDGIFKVELHFLPGDADFPRQNGFLGNAEQDLEASFLECPSGEVVIASPYGLGGRLTPFGIVPPGRYRAAVQWGGPGEERHWFLEEFSEYPPADGPDGVVFLQRADRRRPDRDAS